MPPAAGIAQGHMGAEQQCCSSLGCLVGSGVPAGPQEKISSILCLLPPAAVSLPLPACSSFKPSWAATLITAGRLRWPWPWGFTWSQGLPWVPSWLEVASHHGDPVQGLGVPCLCPHQGLKCLGWATASAGTWLVLVVLARGHDLCQCHQRQWEAGDPEVTFCHHFKGQADSTREMPFSFCLPEVKVWRAVTLGGPHWP